MPSCSFRESDWQTAVAHYTDAIAGAQNIEKRNSVLPSMFRNRSSAFFALKDLDNSLRDAKSSLQIEPRNTKVKKLILCITRGWRSQVSKVDHTSRFASVRVLYSSQGNYRAGRALFALGNFKDATRYLSAALVNAQKLSKAEKSAKETEDVEKWKSKANAVSCVAKN